MTYFSADAIMLHNERLAEWVRQSDVSICYQVGGGFVQSQPIQQTEWISQVHSLHSSTSFCWTVLRLLILEAQAP